MASGVPDGKLSVLFEDEDVLVVNKPPNIATEPDKSGAVSLRDLVFDHTRPRGLTRAPHAVSRLDLPVSGAVLFALTERAAKHFAQIDKLVDYQRTYLGLCAGTTALPPRFSRPVDGRAAESHFAVVAALGNTTNGPMLAALRPVTGRTHQLRLHLQAAGAPLLGDKRYGGLRRLVDASGRVMDLERPMLHAHHLAFVTPAAAKHRVICPIPADFRDAWSWLDGPQKAWEGATEVCDAHFWPASSESSAAAR